MYIHASQLLTAEIVSIVDEARIGRIEELLFSGDEGRLSALVVKPGGFFTKSVGLLPSAIIDLQPGAAVIQDQADLTELAEMVRVEQLRKRRTPILGQKAQTKSGVSLGIVSDLVLDAGSWLIEKCYLQKMLNHRIVPKRFIVEVTPRAVIFADDLIEPSPGLEQQTESVPA